MYGSLVAQFSRETKNCSDHPKRMSEDRKQFLKDMILDEIRELFEAKSIQDEQDALVDIIYYVVDQAIYHGVNPDPVFALVHKANMRKRFPDGTFHQRGDGKVIKPEGWKPEDLSIYTQLINQIELGPINTENSFMDHIYLASPYSSPIDRVKQYRYDKISKIYVDLIRTGRTVFAPITFCHNVAREFDLHGNFTYWKTQDLYFIRTCRALVVAMLDGWQESEGVSAELQYAKYWGKEIGYIDPYKEGLEIYLDPECTRHAETI